MMNDQIEKTVNAFAASGDRRDVASLETLLDPGFRIIFTRPGDERASTMTRAEYLEGLARGQLGGIERKVEVKATTVKGAIAFAEVSMLSAKMSFDSMMTFVRDRDQWRLIEDTTSVSSL